VEEDGRWTFAGALVFADAAAVFEASRSLPLPASGIVDLRMLGQADSSALAVMMALSRRAAAQGAGLKFTGVPQGVVALARAYGVHELLLG